MNANQLIAAYSLLPRIPSSDDAHSWLHRRTAMRDHVANNDLREFLRWSTIQATMYVGDGEIAVKEYFTLRIKDKERWDQAVQYNPIGSPHEMSMYPGIDPNLAHQAYHLMQLEQAMAVKVDEIETIVEFGGGYGAMCLICRRLGFRGKYIIYDLPEMSLLQEDYLDQQGVKPADFISTDNDHQIEPSGCDFLIACYSLSEVSADLRNSFLQSCKARAILIATQDRYGEYDLKKEFSRYFASCHGYSWWFKKNRFIPGDFYIIGKRTRSKKDV